MDVLAMPPTKIGKVGVTNHSSSALQVKVMQSLQTSRRQNDLIHSVQSQT